MPSHMGTGETLSRLHDTKYQVMEPNVRIIQNTRNSIKNQLERAEPLSSELCCGLLRNKGGRENNLHEPLGASASTAAWPRCCRHARRHLQQSKSQTAEKLRTLERYKWFQDV